MPSPPLRQNFNDTIAPGPGDLAAAEYNLNAERTDDAYDFAVAAYKPGGADVALADGGTGASLTDPNADRIMFWDDSAGATTWLTPGANLTITGTTIDAAGGGSVDVAGATHAAASKTTPVDIDELPLVDSAAAFTLKRLTWLSIKGTIKSYYDGVTTTMTNKTLTSPILTTPRIPGGSPTVGKVLTATDTSGNFTWSGGGDAGIYYAKDYGVVANGSTNDASALNALITTVSTAGGGVVVLPVGTMIVNSSIIMKSNVTLRGQGWASIIKLGANINGYGAVHIDGCTRIVVENLKIDGNRSVLTGGSSVNCGIQGGGPTIEPAGGGYSDVLIQNVWVDSPNYSGILILGSGTRAVTVKNVRILDCKVTNAGGHGIDAQWGVDQCWIQRCAVVGYGLVYTDSLGICNGRFAYDTHMIDNFVDATGAIGVSANSVSIDTPYSRFTCKGNTIINSVAIALEICMTTDGSVTGNHIFGGANFGIKFTSNEANYPGVSNLGVTVADNVIDGAEGGIGFHMGNPIASQNCPASRTILRNTAYTAGATIRAVEGRRIYECTTSGTSHATVKPATWGTTATAATITDGTTVWTDRGATNAQLAIAGNVVRNCVGSGIEVTYAHLVSVTGNVVTNCTKSGIYVGPNANMLTITGNDVQGNNTTLDAAHGGLRFIGYNGAAHVVKIVGNRSLNNVFGQDVYATDSVSGGRIENRFPASATQPSVAYGSTFFTQNTVATTINSFLDGNDTDTRTIFVRVNDAFTTFAHSASGTNTLRLNGGTNYAAPSGTIMQFTWAPSIVQWVEVSRNTIG